MSPPSLSLRLRQNNRPYGYRGLKIFTSPKLRFQDFQRKFFTSGSTAGIQSNHAPRIEERLQTLHTANTIEDMNPPGWRLHALKGDKTDLWSINVSGNWRIVFEFKDGHAYIVNYEDYH